MYRTRVPEMKLESVGALFVLVVLCALIAAILFMLVRFWGECRTDTAFAKERLSWPTTTVQATLFDTSLRRYGKTSTTMVIGHYRYEFGGSEHTAEVSERIDGSLEDKERDAEALKAEGKTIELEVQYNPEDSAVVSEVVSFSSFA